MMAQSRRDKSLKGKRAYRTASKRPAWLVWLMAGLGLLLLGGGFWWASSPASGGPPADFTPQAETPRLAVDRDSIDLGPQPLGREVSAVFQVKDVGSQPLRIADRPTVELVEGC
jgi:hypothetical protein